MFCNKCGNELSDDAKFCTKCGFKVDNVINNENKTFKKEYEFWSSQCGKCILTIDNDKITIKRKGTIAFARYGSRGEKTILIPQISAIQLKENGPRVGYIQFVIIGSQENKGGLKGAVNDENTIVFDGGLYPNSVNAKAREIKEYIENYNSRPKTSNNVTNVYNSSDKYDKLAKIKKLLDDGVLTQEEFEIEKKKILN